MSVSTSVSRFINRYSAIIVICAAFAIGGVANAAGATITVSPDTNLKNGQVVSVSGSGFDKNAPGGISECNDDTSQPTIVVASVAKTPVSCTNPFGSLMGTDGSGNLPATNFTIKTGTVGPPATGTDSAGHSAAADAALYPCPPTPAQIAAGDVCQISYGTGSATTENASVNISFYSSTATGGGGTTPPPAAATPSATATTASSTTSSSSLVNTGPGNIAFVAAALTAVTASGYFLYNRIKKAKN